MVALVLRVMGGFGVWLGPVVPPRLGCDQMDGFLHRAVGGWLRSLQSPHLLVRALDLLAWVSHSTAASGSASARWVLRENSQPPPPPRFCTCGFNQLCIQYIRMCVYIHTHVCVHAPVCFDASD